MKRKMARWQNMMNWPSVPWPVVATSPSGEHDPGPGRPQIINIFKIHSVPKYPKACNLQRNKNLQTNKKVGKENVWKKQNAWKKTAKISASCASGEVLGPKSGDEAAVDAGEVHLETICTNTELMQGTQKSGEIGWYLFSGRSGIDCFEDVLGTANSCCLTAGPLERRLHLLHFRHVVQCCINACKRIQPDWIIKQKRWLLEPLLHGAIVLTQTRHSSTHLQSLTLSDCLGQSWPSTSAARFTIALLLGESGWAPATVAVRKDWSEKLWALQDMRTIIRENVHKHQDTIQSIANPQTA